jgi:hypothetical protein
MFQNIPEAVKGAMTHRFEKAVDDSPRLFEMGNLPPLPHSLNLNPFADV